MSQDPKDYNFPQIDILQSKQLDNLGRALLTLTRELCVVADRQMVMEKVLEAKGLDVSKAIDEYQPDEAMQQQINARISAIIKSVIDDISGAKAE